MGDIFQGIFGGSKSSQESGNTNNAYIKKSLDPQVQLGTAAGGLLASLFGLKGKGAGDAAMQQYKDSSAFNFLTNEGQRALTSSAAARGQLNSGGTLKALQDRGQQFANTFQNDYFDRLLGLGNMGNQAAGLIGQAGTFSKGKSSEKPGIGGFLGSMASGAAASDRRLKTKIEKLGEMYDGLGLYAWNYIWGGARKIGVMADEVAALRPWALGPEVEGYATVNYEKL